MRGEVLVFQLPPGKAALSRSYLEMANEPLLARAWALQERAAAPTLLFRPDLLRVQYGISERRRLSRTRALQ
jgi:hypothetical protein